MRQFDNVLEREIAANVMPAGTVIIASAPLPPESRTQEAGLRLQSNAGSVDEILSSAAGR
jgi:hypothetical protein